MPFLCGAYATRTLIGCIVCLYSTRATAVAINRYLPTTDCSRQDIKSAATNAERAEAARKKPGKNLRRRNAVRRYYTHGEMTSQNLWPRYDRHFVGNNVAKCVELRSEDLSCYINNIQSVG